MSGLAKFTHSFQEKIQQQPFAKLCHVEVNPDSQMEESEAVSQFITYMEPFLQPQSIQERLPPSDVVGNIRFSHPHSPVPSYPTHSTHVGPATPTYIHTGAEHRTQNTELDNHRTQNTPTYIHTGAEHK